MKITAILILAASLHVSATGYSQITLSEKNAPLQKVFKEIQRQSGYDFLYSAELLDQAGKVDLDLHDVTLQAALDECLKDKQLTYSIVERTVVVKPKDVAAPSPSERGGGEVSVIDIKGKLVNESGEPIAGATIQVKGSAQATATDADGIFSLRGVDENATLIFTGANIETQEVKLKGRKDFIVSARTKITTGEDVVINKGYYTEKHRLSVGNVTRVDGKDIEKQPVTDPLLALEGRVPGLSITQVSGVPGAYSKVQLRGQNFLVGVNPGQPVSVNDPLYVVDGVPFSSESLTDPFGGGGGILGIPSLQDNIKGIRSGMSPFNILNTSDIESIEVLKDADATAIYGARGANGVILITTKKGKAGPLKVDINLYSGTNTVTRKLDMLNNQQYLQMRNEAYKNDGLTPNAAAYDVNGIWDTLNHTNWQKVLINRPASFTNAQANLSGGNANIQYLIGGGYSRQGTTMPGDYADQNTSLHLNIKSISNNQRLHVNLTSFYIVDNSNLPSNANLISALTLAPDAPALYDANGNLNWQPVGGTATFSNPLAITKSHAKANSTNLNANLALSYQLLPGLQVLGNFGYTRNQMNSLIFTPSSASPPPNDFPFLRSAGYFNGDLKTWIIEPQISFHKITTIGTLDILLGSTFEQNSLTDFDNEGLVYSSDAVIPNPAAATYYLLGGYNLNSYKYNSIYSRVGYNWQQKYLVNLTGRRDGSSRFGRSKLFGNFWSVGVGWVFSEEHFVKKNLSWLSFGKLRASYGTVGSDAIGDYQYVRTYSFSSGTTYQNTPTLDPNNHANPYFAWQVNQKLEYGLELGFLQDRINFTMSYYRNRSGNQLVSYPLPVLSGLGSVVENLNALVQNTGWEFTLNTLNIPNHVVRWTSSINVSLPQNKLISFPGLENSSYLNRYSIGRSFSSVRVFHYLGVNPQTGTYSFASKNGTGTQLIDADKVWSAPITRKYEGGVSNAINYKGFTLDIFFQFVKQLGYSYQQSFGRPGSYNGNEPTVVLNRWQSYGDQINVQRFTTGSYVDANAAYTNFLASDGIITDASFIRLKNVALSYRLPDSWQRRAHIQGARLYLQCQNLLTVTNYRVLDPETQGLNMPYRTVTVGIQVTL